MEEHAVLHYFQENFTTNPKKLKKMAARLLPNAAPFIRRGFLLAILEERDPVGYLRKCLTDMAQYEVIIKNLIETGNHGMIVINDVIIPVKIAAESNWLKVTDKWNLEEEIEIQHKLCRIHMANEGMQKMHGKIVLFPAFGFSGHTREIGPDFKLEG
jgi:hypothetical protein